MSTLLEQASLVLIPSGYKEDVVYSQIPTNGNGDLSFTRASNGTRVNSAGLVEVCPWNLLEQSNTFATSPWSKSAGTTLTSGQTDPNGGSSAFRIQMSSANNFLASGVFTVVSGSIYTYTIYIKSNTGSNQSFRILDGVRGVAGGVLNGTATTSWQRFEVQITPNSTSGALQLDNTGGAYSNDLLIAFSQANLGSTAKPYFPTTDRLNVPRLTYQNGGGGCPSLLLEKQSTNIITYSEQFDNAAWTKASATVSANSAISPDGTQNADLIYPTSSASNLGAYQFNAGVISVVGTVSCYVKSAGKNWALLGTDNTSPYNVSFDLVNGVVGSVPSGYTATITSVGNGWYRITATFQIGSSLGYPFIGVADNTNRSVTADGTNGIYIWGFQAELSSYVTSYINTTSASATRVADACSKTGISSLIGQTEGVFFVEATIEDISSNHTFLRAGVSSSFSNSIIIEMSAGVIYGVVYVSSVAQCLISSPTQVEGNNVKIALAYKANDFALYINGVQIGTDNSGSVPSSVGSLWVGNNSATEQTPIKQAVLFKTRLTNAELASLTTI